MEKVGVALNSLRARLMFLVLVSLLPTLAVATSSGFETIDYAVHSAQDRELARAESITKQQALVIEGAKQLLYAVSKLDFVRDALPADRRALQEYFHSLVSTPTNTYSNILLFSPSGDLLADAFEGTAPFSIADREYFRRALRERRFVVGSFIVSRSTGLASLPFALPILDRDGNPMSVLVASFNLGKFGKYFQSEASDPGHWFEILDAEGYRLYRSPESLYYPVGVRIHDLSRGGDASKGKALRAGIDSKQGFLVATSSLSLDQGMGIDFYARTYTADTEAGRVPSGIVSRNLAVNALAALLSIALAWFLGGVLISKRIQRTAAIAKRVGQGSYALGEGSDSGKDEIGELNRAMYGMVDALAERDKQREKVERELRDALAEKEVLIKEIHHRVKNNFQTISSLLSLQSEFIDDPRALEVFEESENRIKSMALIHEKLYQSETLSHIDFGDYCVSMAQYLQSSYYNSRNISIEIDAVHIDVSLDMAIPLGLILNELVSNAFKHAFGKGAEASGSISVRFSPVSDTQCILEVSDSGAGLPDDFGMGVGTSLGMQLVATLASQIKGIFEFSNRPSGAGARFAVRFPH
jgi:two-component sensor histidine kinase